MRLPFILTACIFCTSLFAQSRFVSPDEYLRLKTAGKKYTPEQIQRFSDLGKLWGALHFFNPKMYSGGIKTDSLALKPIRILMNDPSASGFRQSVQAMLGILNDGGTKLLPPGKTSPSLLFTRGSKTPVVHQLPGGQLYIAFPTSAADELDNPSSIKGLMPDQWTDAKAIIIDIRNATAPGAYGDFTFLYDVLPTLMKAVAGNKVVPAVYERTVYHSGFVSQSSSAPNIYSSGFLITASGDFTNLTKQPPLGKPVVIVYNEYTHEDIIKQLSALRATGLCRLVFEGDGDNYRNGAVAMQHYTDDITVSIRVSEFLLSENKTIPRPDLVVEKISDTSLTSPYIQKLIALTDFSKETNSTSTVTAADFIMPKPNRYSDTLVPPADQRLFGLYNFWNSFNYFSPYKEVLDHSWDSIITKYVPVFLNADDSGSYNLAIRALASATQDCHAFVNSTFKTTPARKDYGAWPPILISFIQHKLYITNIASDSSQDLSNIRLWDEVTHIDGLPISQQKEKWRQYFGTSNESTFERDVPNYLINGPLNSTVNLTLLRDKKPVQIFLKRNGRWPLANSHVDQNWRHKVVELLPGNIGYVNMGSLRPRLVDSTMKAFAKTSAIIFDIRNYPQGTAWQIAPYLTGTSKKAVLFDKPFVTADYPRGGEDLSTLKSYFTVEPRKKGESYKGKIIIHCDEHTQSQAEYTIMMFQGATACTTVGSQTAGADGNVTEIVLPGGYGLSLSGLGIYYPDGTPTQRQGIKVDIQSRPTLEGLRAGKDEVLNRALEFLEKNK